MVDTGVSGKRIRKNMKYKQITEAIFKDRPNRFIAHVMLDGKEEAVHVKNTGRCKELLIPGTRVWLEKGAGEGRKTQWDLVTIEKQNRLINLCLLYTSFRMGFARTRREARQIVDHKHVLVNGKQVNIPSYLIKAGDVIEIKESKKNTTRYKEIMEATAGNLIPEWLDVNSENLQGTVKELPKREAIDVPVDEMLIVELYSK